MRRSRVVGRVQSQGCRGSSECPFARTSHPLVRPGDEISYAPRPHEPPTVQGLGRPLQALAARRARIGPWLLHDSHDEVLKILEWWTLLPNSTQRNTMWWLQLRSNYADRCKAYGTHLSEVQGGPGTDTSCGKLRRRAGIRHKE